MALGGPIWTILGVEPTNEEREVRRAYARRLKEVHPEDDAEGFQALREAYERALDMARRGWAVPPARKPRKKKADTVTETPTSDDSWADDNTDRWSEAVPPSNEDWEDADTDRWVDAPSPPAPPPVLPPEIAAELEAEKARQDAHAVMCDQLEGLLRQTIVPSGDALSLLLRIFRSPAMDSLRVHTSTEHWLAHAIARGGPAADSLIEPAVRFFGWDNGRVGVDMSYVAPVLRRRETARIIQQLARPMTPGHDAWKALRTRQTLFRRITDRLDLSLSRDVADLLSRAAHDLPDLYDHLDPDAVATWRARLARPRFSAFFLLCLLVAPAVIALIVVSTGTFGPSTLPNILAAWVVALAVMTGVGAAWVNGVLKPAQDWADAYPWDAPLWKRLGWAPASVALLAVAPFFTGVDWLWPAVLSVGLGVVGWARVVTSHIQAKPASRYRIAEYIGIVPILFYVLFTPGSGSQPALAAAMVSATLAFRFGGHAVVQEWLYQSPARQRLASMALIGSAAVVGGLSIMAARSGAPGLTIGLVCGFAFMDRALATDRFGPAFQLRRGWLTMGWLGAWVVAGMTGPMEKTVPVAFALWLVIAGVITGVAAFLPDPDRKKRRPGALA